MGDLLVISVGPTARAQRMKAMYCPKGLQLYVLFEWIIIIIVKEENIFDNNGEGRREVTRSKGVRHGYYRSTSSWWSTSSTSSTST